MLLFVTLSVWSWLITYFWFTITSLCVAPFLFNPHQFSFSDFIIDYRYVLLRLIFRICNKNFRPQRIFAMDVSRQLAHSEQFVDRILSSFADYDHWLQEEETWAPIRETFGRRSKGGLGSRHIFGGHISNRFGDLVYHRLHVRQVFPWTRRRPTSKSLDSDCCYLVGAHRLECRGSSGDILHLFIPWAYAGFHVPSFRVRHGVHSTYAWSSWNYFLFRVSCECPWFSFLICDSFFPFQWFLEFWDVSHAILGLMAVIAIQRAIHKILISVFLSREFKHDETNRAWWTGKWYGRGLGAHVVSQPAREFVVKIIELSLWSSDLILGHILLFILTLPLLIPYIDTIHATLLCKREILSRFLS
jgi:hypothetical protein